MPTSALQNKVSDRLRRIGLWVVPNQTHQIAKNNLIGVETTVERPAAPTHPVPELTKDRPFFGRGWRLRQWRDQALIFEKKHEESASSQPKIGVWPFLERWRRRGISRMYRVNAEARLVNPLGPVSELGHSPAIVPFVYLRASSHL